MSLPCVLVASSLQYLRFAKKPMAEPCHRLTDRCARRCVFAGLAAELVGLWLLPLCQAYPMNASCLVCLFFWKETKRSRTGWQFSEVVACVTALSAWLLPFVDPMGGRLPEVLQDEVLLDVVLAPRTCLYVASALLGGILVHCRNHGESAFGSVAAPAANFGVSAIFLKALVHVVVSIVTSPLRPSLWLAVAVLLGLLLWVRNAASAPLRRAFEAHDKLTVLASYGFASSTAAALTGGFVYRETDSWSVERQVLSFTVALAHCWGMASLGSRTFAAERDGGKGGGGRNSGGQAKESGRALQLAEMPGRVIGGSSKQPLSALDGRPPSPLLNFSSSARTVDEDAQIEDQLLARALAPQHLSSVMGGVGAPSVDEPWGAFPENQQFDADFEEIMRRFDEDDKKMSACGGGEATQQIVPITGVVAQDDFNPSLPTVEPSGPLSGAVGGGVVMDAGDLLDVSFGGMDEEEQLLQSIQDVEDL